MKAKAKNNVEQALELLNKVSTSVLSEYENNLTSRTIKLLTQLLADIPVNETCGEKALREINAKPLPWEI